MKSLLELKKLKKISQKEKTINPNKSGIEEKPPAFVQNDFTP